MAAPVVVARTRKPLWQALAWLLIGAAVWDGASLAFGPAHYFSSPSYFAVRALPGLRPLGFALLIIAVTFTYTLGAPNRTRLCWVLIAGFVYNLYWLAALVYSWATVGVVAPTGPTKALVFAGLYLLLVTHIDERRGG